VAFDAAGRGTVVDVTQGSTEWLMGARPGAAYERIDGGGGITLVSGGATTDLPDSWTPLPLAAALVALLLAIAALVLWRSLPMLARCLLVLATSIALADLVGRVTGPLAVLVVSGSIAAAGIAILDGSRPHHRAWAFAAVTLAVVLGVCIAALVLPDPMTAVAFELATTVPLMVTVGMAAGITFANAYGARSADALDPIVGPVMATSRPVRRLMRTSAESERDRIARRIHDRVMPRVVASIRLLERQDIDGSSVSLRYVADDLRDVITEEQLVVLRDGACLRRSETRRPLTKVKAHGSRRGSSEALARLGTRRWRHCASRRRRWGMPWSTRPQIASPCRSLGLAAASSSR
jgi:hypothetical protein